MQCVETSIFMLIAPDLGGGQLRDIDTNSNSVSFQFHVISNAIHHVRHMHTTNALDTCLTKTN